MPADMASSDYQRAYRKALDALARREHSTQELQRKLGSAGFAADIVEPLLSELREQGLQSDTRFAEAYLRSAINRGHGPARIRRDLAARGIQGEALEIALEGFDGDWFAHLQAVREKKFGASIPADFKDKSRQARFLEYRGFSADMIRRALF